MRDGIFVARDTELQLLDDSLRTALSGRGQIRFIAGQAGTGKTALFQHFVQQALESDPKLIVLAGTCNAQTGVGDPYLPFREAMSMLTSDNSSANLGPLASENAQRLRLVLVRSIQVLVEVAPDLIGIFVPGAKLVGSLGKAVVAKAGWMDKLEGLTEQRDVPTTEQGRIFEQYTTFLQELSSDVPLILFLDDLQWADRASIGLLFHLCRHIENDRILILGAYRPNDVALGRDGDRHPLDPVVHELMRYYGDIFVDLDGISQERNWHFISALLDSELNCFQDEFREALYHQTSGHALFTVELMRALRERNDIMQDDSGCWVEAPSLDWSELPARVEGVIEERIDRLDESLRDMLTVASVEGEQFTAEVIAQVQSVAARQAIRQISSDLDRRHRLVSPQGAVQLSASRLSLYRFSHNLFHTYVYDNLDELERAYLHEDVGTVLETLYGDRAGEIAAELARHFRQAGIIDKAVRYHLEAAKRATVSSAYDEAITHLTAGLDLIRLQPELPEHMEYELTFQASLGPHLVATKGWGAPDAERAYLRACDLCQRLGNESVLASVLYGLATLREFRGEYVRSEELLQERLRLPPSVMGAQQMLESYELLSCSTFHQGKFVQSLEHVERGLEFYDGPRRSDVQTSDGQDLGVACHTWAAMDLWCLGYPDQAAERMRTALDLAEVQGQRYTLARVLSKAAIFYQLRREPDLARDHAEASLAYATNLGFPYYMATATMVLGWARALLGSRQEGIDQLREALAAFDQTKTEIDRPLFLGLLADAYISDGQMQRALAVLDEALQSVSSGRPIFYEAELHRLRGSVLQQAGPQQDWEAAEASLEQALAVAHQQHARSLELRAILSLSKLREAQGYQGEREMVHAMLAETFGWFNEGFDTPDLREASKILDAGRS
jgi:predicted ATPase